MQFRLSADRIRVKQQDTGVKIARYIGLPHQPLQLADAGAAFVAYFKTARRPLCHHTITYGTNRTTIEIEQEKRRNITDNLSIAVDIKNATSDTGRNMQAPHRSC
ncbi:hypothetical protein D3C81_1899130 [compost metagenome]